MTNTTFPLPGPSASSVDPVRPRLGVPAKRLTVRAAMVAAGAVLLLGACGGGDGGTTIAKGTGNFQGWTVKLSATEDDGKVSGEAKVTDRSQRPLTLTLACSGEAADGVVIIGGEVSESEDDERPVGTRAAILVKEGNPDGMVLWFEDPPPAASCGTFVENLPKEVLADPNTYQPIDGDIKTG